jgi:hypothetical protein
LGNLHLDSSGIGEETVDQWQAYDVVFEDCPVQKRISCFCVG